ncbi:MAG: T9SS type A sorting domain-containing protein [Spirochaetes bacterium]|nr:T9SS type A sorting domain-containing protein [Spirochaetota bacterium]
MKGNKKLNHRSIYYYHALIFLLLFSFIQYKDLHSSEIRLDFNNSSGLEYNTEEVIIHKGKLKLAVTGYWENTGILSDDKLPGFLYMDSQENLFHCASHVGATPYSTYKSSNHGTNWIEVRNDTVSHIMEASDGNLYAACYYNNSIDKSYNRGNTWNVILAGEEGSCVLENSQQRLFAATHDDNFPSSWSSNFIWVSTNYGTNWTKIYKEGVSFYTTGLRFYALFEITNEKMLIRRIGAGSLSTGILYSSNYGINWQLVQSLSNFNCDRIFRASDGSIYVSGSSGIVRSIDQAQTWALVSAEASQGLIEGQDDIFYKIENDNVWRSLDKGMTWTRGKDTVYSYTGSRIVQTSDGKIYFGKAFNDSSGYVFRSGYPGTNQIIVNIIPDYVYRWLSFDRSDVLNGGNVIYEFAYSQDRGVNWSGWTALDNTALQDVVCLGNGSDRLKIRISLISDNHNRTPEVDYISLQYDDGAKDNLDNAVLAPNPFEPGSDNDTITFFNLPSVVHLKVYSLGGSLIYERNNIRTSGGRCTWNGKKDNNELLKSGVYICSLKDNSNNEKTLKLIIIR